MLQKTNELEAEGFVETRSQCDRLKLETKGFIETRERSSR